MFGPTVQIAYVVDDPHLAAAAWERRGAGPFVIRDHIEVTEVVHRGEPSSFDHTSAYGWWGSTMIELFCQHDDEPTAVTERFGRRGPDGRRAGGLHHVACFVESFDTSIDSAARLGLEVAMTARAGSTRFAFVDDVARHGHYWEIYEGSEALRGFYDHVETLHRSR